MKEFLLAPSELPAENTGGNSTDFNSITAAERQKESPKLSDFKFGYFEHNRLDSVESNTNDVLNAETAADIILKRAMEDNSNNQSPDNDNWPTNKFEPYSKPANNPKKQHSQELNTSNGELTAQSLGDYLKTKFNAIDQNNDGLLNISEMSKYSERFLEGKPTEEMAFAQENYFALSSLSDDRMLNEKGISLTDIEQLYKNKRQPTSIGDFITSTNSIVGRDPIHLGVSAALALNLFRTLHPATNLVLIGAFGLRLAAAGNNFMQQQKRVDKLFKNQ